MPEHTAGDDLILLGDGELSVEEKDALQRKLDSVFGDVLNISEEINRARELGDEAKSKAENAKSGFFRNSQAIEDLKESQSKSTDVQLMTLDMMAHISEGQQQLATACRGFVQLGMVDLASNRAVIDFIQKSISGEDSTIDALTKEALLDVISELKNKEDLMQKQRMQGSKINSHEKRIDALEDQAEDLYREIENANEYDREQDKELDRQAEKDADHDRLFEEKQLVDANQDDILEKYGIKLQDQSEMISIIKEEVKSLSIIKRNNQIAIAIASIALILSIIQFFL